MPIQMAKKTSDATSTGQSALDRLRGKFIVFDGVDGAGKGVQLGMLRDALTARNIPITDGKDPGGTEIGDRIRHVLFDYDLSVMDVRCEALLFMASRAQLMHDVIEPALAANRAVLCDRFVSATCAYQGAAGFDPQRVIDLARFAIDDRWPDLTIILDVPIDEGFHRTGRAAAEKRKNSDVHGQVRLFHDTHIDAMEARPATFHERVRELFLKLPDFYPAPVAIVDGRGTVEEVHTRLIKAIEDGLR